mmetsp:Transcript_57771/g.141101  ORF Transcript_57771/g.141101 Transcript_57771/m.141101 type:complete len:630 (-) Transcript_57771:95-1984(-)
MGAVHSIDSCSGAGEEHRKDDLLSVPVSEEAAPSKSKTDSSSRDHSNPKDGIHVDDHQEANGNGCSDGHLLHNGHKKHSHLHLSSLTKGLSKRVKKPSLRLVRTASTVTRSLFGHCGHEHDGNTGNGAAKNTNSRHSRHSRRGNNKQWTNKKPTSAVATKVRGGVLLHGCLTDQEHKEKVQQILDIVRSRRRSCSSGGSNSDSRSQEERISYIQETLAECGFEYRQVELQADGRPILPLSSSQKCHDKNSDDKNIDENTNAEGCKDDKAMMQGFGSQKSEIPPKSMTMLFHASTGTLITTKNRKKFIADGDMYDAIARAAMEYSQEVMMNDASLEWVTVEESANNPEPIRALVSKCLLEDETLLDTAPTLLVITGKGKVRAGIFSRQHLLVSGMECSTAIPIVREAKIRNMNVIMLDPNVHGDRLGMVTFEKSMAKIFRRWEEGQQAREDERDDDDHKITSRSNKVLTNESSGSSSSAIRGTNREVSSCRRQDLFVLSHSASGAQLQRYLLDHYRHYVPHIRAICFTDSTHNIQWTKGKDELQELLESDRSVYFKSSKEPSEDLLNPLPSLGKKLETDGYWRHRFGSISTRCAGTSEHSLTNFFTQPEMWKHFDRNSLDRQEEKDTLLN